MLLADLALLAALCLLAAGVGLLGNALRGNPVPLRYISAQKRLQTALKNLAAAAPASRLVAEIDLVTFQRVAGGRTALILDARPDVFYRAGHVPGALNLARESFGPDYARLRARLEAAKDRQIVVYCSDADCPDSGLVASALQQLGCKNIVDFAAGWQGWTEAGLPEEKQTLP